MDPTVSRYLRQPEKRKSTNFGHVMRKRVLAKRKLCNLRNCTWNLKIRQAQTAWVDNLNNWTRMTLQSTNDRKHGEQPSMMQLVLAGSRTIRVEVRQSVNLTASDGITSVLARSSATATATRYVSCNLVNCCITVGTNCTTDPQQSKVG